MSGTFISRTGPICQDISENRAGNLNSLGNKDVLDHGTPAALEMALSAAKNHGGSPRCVSFKKTTSTTYLPGVAGAPGGVVLGPKLLVAMGCVKLGEQICVHLPSVGEQTAN